MNEDSVEQVRAQLEAANVLNANLQTQLQFARQKASLYYITASELDSLKRRNSSTDIAVLKREVGTCTSEDWSGQDDGGRDERSGCVAVQTEEYTSEAISVANELRSLAQQCEALKAMSGRALRADKCKLEYESALERVAKDVVDPDQVIAELVRGYTDLLEFNLSQSRLSIDHSVEIKRRDEMISSLFDKIRVMENGFSMKLMHSEAVAVARQEVIKELSEQVKDAMQIDRMSRSGDEAQFGWREMAAMHSELEDTRAELSKARTNWAATRDELMRIQFGLAPQSTQQSYAQDSYAKYPSPARADAQLAEASPPGLIQGMRKIRYSTTPKQ